MEFQTASNINGWQVLGKNEFAEVLTRYYYKIHIPSNSSIGKQAGTDYCTLCSAVSLSCQYWSHRAGSFAEKMLWSVKDSLKKNRCPKAVLIHINHSSKTKTKNTPKYKPRFLHWRNIVITSYSWEPLLKYVCYFGPRKICWSLHILTSVSAHLEFYSPRQWDRLKVWWQSPLANIPSWISLV